MPMPSIGPANALAPAPMGAPMPAATEPSQRPRGNAKTARERAYQGHKPGASAILRQASIAPRSGLAVSKTPVPFPALETYHVIAVADHCSITLSPRESG